MTKKVLIDLIKNAPEDSLVTFEYGGVEKKSQIVETVIIINTYAKKVNSEIEKTTIILR